MEALTQALTLAKTEVIKLRQQCDALRALTLGSHSTGDRPAHPPKLGPLYDDPKSNTPDQAQLHPAPFRPTRSDIPLEIAELTGDEARQVLAVGKYPLCSSIS